MTDTVYAPVVKQDAVVYASISDPLAKPLLDDLHQEYAARYPEQYTSTSESLNEMQKYPPILFTPPGGAFLVLVREGAPIAGGAFMQIDDRTVELKRIWTSAAHRRQGLSLRVVAELEREAARRGFTRIYLTTGSRQPEAVHLYLRTGYTPLFDLDADPESVGLLAFEKAIVPNSSPRARGISARIHAWKQQRAIRQARVHHAPILRRLDDLVVL